MDAKLALLTVVLICCLLQPTTSRPVTRDTDTGSSGIKAALAGVSAVLVLSVIVVIGVATDKRTHELQEQEKELLGMELMVGESEIEFERRKDKKRKEMREHTTDKRAREIQALEKELSCMELMVGESDEEFERRREKKRKEIEEKKRKNDSKDDNNDNVWVDENLDSDTMDGCLSMFMICKMCFKGERSGRGGDSDCNCSEWCGNCCEWCGNCWTGFIDACCQCDCDCDCDCDDD